MPITVSIIVTAFARTTVTIAIMIPVIPVIMTVVAVPIPVIATVAMIVAIPVVRAAMAAAARGDAQHANCQGTHGSPFNPDITVASHDAFLSRAMAEDKAL
jgi:hypothetical protein